MTPNSPWAGRFVWHDLMTTEAAKAQQFYTSLFDWQIQELAIMGSIYRMVSVGPGPVGGIMEDPRVKVSHWLPYLAVNDVDVMATKCKELGGSVCVPPSDIPNTGRFAVVTDPQGAYFALYKGLPESQGFDPDLAVPGRVCWNELLSTDDVGAQRFYTALLGWREQPQDLGPMGTYRVQMLGDKMAAGLMKHPMPGAPSVWMAYFLAPDLPVTTARAKQLGAAAMVECQPIPGVGAFSLLADPVGAVFALLSMG